MNTMPSNEDLLQCAVEAARAGGSHAVRNQHRRTEIAQVAKNDVKLVLDIECQQIAGDVIRAHYPDHALLGEEDVPHDAPAADPAGKGPSSLQWIIDPIDGTVNFSHGMLFWCCSIAVRRGDEVLAGAVNGPAIGELYTATADGPALCNGRELHVSGVSDLTSSIVMTGTNTDADQGRPRYDVLEKIAESVQRPRISGSAALDVCQVAAGRADGYFEWGIYIWDVAAAGLMVDRAGGQTEVLAHGANYRMRFLATNGKIHADLKDLVGPPA